MFDAEVSLLKSRLDAEVDELKKSIELDLTRDDALVKDRRKMEMLRAADLDNARKISGRT